MQGDKAILRELVKISKDLKETLRGHGEMLRGHGEMLRGHEKSIRELKGMNRAIWTDVAQTREMNRRMDRRWRKIFLAHDEWLKKHDSRLNLHYGLLSR